jgi:hypothetical protein
LGVKVVVKSFGGAALGEVVAGDLNAERSGALAEPPIGGGNIRQDDAGRIRIGMIALVSGNIIRDVSIDIG